MAKGVYPEFIPESCSLDLQQGNVRSLAFLSGANRRQAQYCKTNLLIRQIANRIST